MGFQYYRAPTPDKTEWAKDLERIASDGYNTVKYWIQWRWNEPEELYKRDWDAKKRAKEFQSMLKNWDKNQSKGCTEYNKYYEGYLSQQGSPFWVAADLSSISDRQEAVALLQYGISIIDWKYPQVKGDLRKAKLEKEKAKLEAKLKEWT